MKSLGRVDCKHGTLVLWFLLLGFSMDSALYRKLAYSLRLLKEWLVQFQTRKHPTEDQELPPRVGYF